MNNFGFLITALSGVLYGSIGYFGSRLTQEGLTVPEFLFWRFFFSSILLFPFALFFWNKKKLTRNYFAFFLLFLFGIFFYGGGTALYFEASQKIGTGLAMVLFYTYPLFVVSLSYFIHKIPLTKPVLISLFLILTGCSLIAFGNGFQASLDSNGLLLAVFSGVMYGLYLVFSKRYANEIDPLLATFTVCLGSSATFALHTLVTGQSFYCPNTMKIWGLIGFFSLLGTVLPVLFMLIGLKYISANKASIISVLEPVTVLMVGMALLEEPVTGIQLLGAFAILSSAIVIQLDR